MEIAYFDATNINNSNFKSPRNVEFRNHLFRLNEKLSVGGSWILRSQSLDAQLLNSIHYRIVQIHNENSEDVLGMTRFYAKLLEGKNEKSWPGETKIKNKKTKPLSFHGFGSRTETRSSFYRKVQYSKRWFYFWFLKASKFPQHVM